MLPRPTGLAPKYALWIMALVGTLLVVSGASSLYFSWRENEAHVIALQIEKARSAASRIQQYVADIEQQIGWTLLPAATVPSPGDDGGLGARRIEFLKLLRQAPAITDAAWIDPQGLEQVRVSRLTPDAVGQGLSRARDPAFTQTADGRIWRSGVTFRKDTEPYLRVARRAGTSGGVTVADINLKFVWEVVSALQLGPQGVAYVVDQQGTLIAHPDISLVLKKTDMGTLPQVSSALLLNSGGTGGNPVTTTSGDAGGDRAQDTAGRPVLAASARIDPLGWTVLVESPRAEALAPLAASAWRLAAVLAGGLVLSALASAMLARTLVQPIRALQHGAERIGAGDLEHRIEVATRDEVQALAERFNQMAAYLQANVRTLETRVAERTHALAEANEAKSRFLAAASHDLRQPVHALGLFVGQLRGASDPAAQRELLGHIEASVASFEVLLESLLDISRLDAGAVPVREQDVALAPLLERLVRGHAGQAASKELRLRARCAGSDAGAAWWVRSDPVLLERVLTNLLGNALRYTASGGVLITARPRDGGVELRVIDTGIGIAADELPKVFREFYRVPGAGASGDPGLGLGLAIVHRLTDLLGHRLELRSAPGRGTCFTLHLPLGTALSPATSTLPADHSAGLDVRTDALRGRRVLVLDDDAAVRQAMQGQLEQWGMEVLLAADGAQAAALVERGPRPDMLLSDLRLADDEDGLAVALQLRSRHALPAAIVTGETTVARVQAVRDAGLPLLTKPLRPARLRAQLEALLAPPP